MWIDTVHPSNVPLLRSFASKSAPMMASPDSVSDPYWKCGSHPDVVTRVCDQLGSVLPAKARCLLCGTPALVLPLSGIVVAVAYGTQYVLRIPTGMLTEALSAGATTVQKWSGGGQTDIQAEFGSDWVFGCYSAKELTWCQMVAAQFELGDIH